MKVKETHKWFKWNSAIKHNSKPYTFPLSLFPLMGWKISRRLTYIKFGRVAATKCI